MLFEHKTTALTVGLIIEMATKWLTSRGCLQPGGQREDSCSGWGIGGWREEDFITLFRMTQNLKCMNYLFLEFSIRYFIFYFFCFVLFFMAFSKTMSLSKKLTMDSDFFRTNESLNIFKKPQFYHCLNDSSIFISIYTHIWWILLYLWIRLNPTGTIKVSNKNYEYSF